MAETRVLLQLLEEEEEEDFLTLLTQLKRNNLNPIFVARETEGLQNILIQRHLVKDDSVFRDFFRLNIKQFNYVLSVIEHDLKRKPCGRVKNPISPVI